MGNDFKRFKSLFAIQLQKTRAHQLVLVEIDIFTDFWDRY